MARKIATANEMFDLLSTMGNGKFATICHMGEVKLNYPDEKVGGFLGFFQHIEKGNPQAFGKRFGLKNLCGIIRITRYRQLNWLSQQKIGSNYNQFRQNANNIRQQFGIPKANTRKSPYETIKYGNGISVGRTPNTQGRAYIHQNTYSAKKDTIYLGIDNLGHIVKEFKYEELKKYFQYSNNIDGLNALQKLTKDNNIINNYINQILALKMQYRTFFNDRIIYMIGSSDKEQFYFTNNNLTSSIGDIYVRPQEIMAKVKELFNADTQIMNENINHNMKNKNSIRLTESQLHRVIKESVEKIISEMTPSKIMTQRNGGSNRAEFRDSDMKKDYEDAEQPWVRAMHKEWEETPEDVKEMYRKNPDALIQALDFFRDMDSTINNQKNHDWEKFGNPNIY